MVCERLVGFISTGALEIILVTSYYAIYLWKVNLDRTQLNIESAATENSVVFAAVMFFCKIFGMTRCLLLDEIVFVGSILMDCKVSTF